MTGTAARPSVPVVVQGRGEEKALLGAFLASERAAAGVLLLGEAGIGKTVLWEHTVSRARDAGIRVLAARARETERRLPYVTLVDLFEDVADEELATLPEGQRRALDAALLRRGDHRSSLAPRNIALSVRAALRALGGRRPLLVAVDDLQWLDPDSARSRSPSGACPRTVGGSSVRSGRGIPVTAWQRRGRCPESRSWRSGRSNPRRSPPC